MGAMGISVIVNTYNRPDALILTLTSLVTQSVLPAEVVIADDGSRDETRSAIEKFALTTNVPVKHVWHEDDGFRRTLILNKAVKAASFEYLLFSDGDCVSDYRCIEKHLEHSRADRLLVGRCVFLSKRLSDRIDEGVIKKRQIKKNVLLPAFFDKSKDTKRPEFAIYLPSLVTRLLNWLKPRNAVLWGSNFSCSKVSYVAVNGFNNTIVGWGGEDHELGYRLENYGLTTFLLKNIAISWHIWHKHDSTRGKTPKQRGVEAQRLKETKQYRCENGYDQA